MANFHGRMHHLLVKHLSCHQQSISSNKDHINDVIRRVLGENAYEVKKYKKFMQKIIQKEETFILFSKISIT